MSLSRVPRQQNGWPKGTVFGRHTLAGPILGLEGELFGSYSTGSSYDLSFRCLEFASERRLNQSELSIMTKTHSSSC